MEDHRETPDQVILGTPTEVLSFSTQSEGEELPEKQPREVNSGVVGS